MPLRLFSVDSIEASVCWRMPSPVDNCPTAGTGAAPLDAICGLGFGGFLCRGGFFTGSGGGVTWTGTGCSGIVTTGGGRLVGDGSGFGGGVSSIGGASG